MDKTSPALVKFEGVTKKFGNVTALEKNSFEVAKGEFVFITGPSGSGKTTILKLILGEIIPSAGVIHVDGVNVGLLKPNDLPLFRQKIGTVFQDFKILNERTVRENVEVALAVIGLQQTLGKIELKMYLSWWDLPVKSTYSPRSFQEASFRECHLHGRLWLTPRYSSLTNRPVT